MSAEVRAQQHQALLLQKINDLRWAMEFELRQVWREEALVLRYGLNSAKELGNLLKKHKIERYPPKRGEIRLHLDQVAKLDEAIRPKPGGK